MYLIDVVKKLTRKSNIFVWLYLLLNVVIIAILVQFFLDNSFLDATIMAIILYIFSLILALSPIGEWILRLQTGCKKIKRMEQLSKIESLFNEVYIKAKQQDPMLPNGIKLYINNDMEPNAFATGRKTICITEGLLYLDDNLIKAALGHELGHLAHKDTDLILMVSVGNFIITGTIVFIRLFVTFWQIVYGIFFSFLGEGSFIATIANALYGLIINIIIMGFMWIWTKIGILLVMKTNRENEFEADKFSFDLGYGDNLCALLDNIECKYKKGLFANLSSSHPNKDDRISRLQKLGSTYKKNYIS